MRHLTNSQIEKLAFDYVTVSAIANQVATSPFIGKGGPKISDMGRFAASEGKRVGADALKKIKKLKIKKLKIK
jgi:hypothetical protein